MVQYRTQVRIIAAILSAAREGGEDEEGAGITFILRKANIPHNRLTQVLGDLVRSGLLEEVSKERGNRYRLSQKGREFLAAYARFEEFAGSFGLRL